MPAPAAPPAKPSAPAAAAPAAAPASQPSSPPAGATPADASGDSPDKGAEAPAGGDWDKLDEAWNKHIGEPAKPAETPKANGSGEETPPADKPAETASAKKPMLEGGPKVLRENLQKALGDLEARDKELSTLRTQLKELESKGGDTAALSEQMAAKDKEIESLRGELSMVKQEASPEFKAKWDEPFNQAAEFSKHVIEQLVVTDEATQQPRQATWEDFTALYRLPLSKAQAKAVEMFGDAAGTVIQEMRDLQKLDYQRSIALQKEKAGWAEKAKADQARKAQEGEAAKAMWATVNKAIADKNPELYQDDPADAEANELRKQGYALVDSGYQGRRQMTLQQRVVFDANMRHRAATQPVALLKVQRLTKENAALKAQIEELKGKGPGPGKPSGGDKGSPKSFLEDMRESLK